MNHPLAVYTVIYVAILFVTVSIWGGKIGEASGDFRVLLLAQGVFSLKLAIDDYVHFQGARRERLEADLALSLLIYLLLAGSIALAASGRGSVAAICFALVFFVGMLWLNISGFSGTGGERRKAWFVINLLALILLALVAFDDVPRTDGYSRASLWLSLLAALLVVDFFCFGTLKRLAALQS